MEVMEAMVMEDLIEEDQKLRNRSGYSASKRSFQIRQVAKVHPSSETKGCPPDQIENPTSNQPVLQYSGSSDSYPAIQALGQIQARDQVRQEGEAQGARCCKSRGQGRCSKQESSSRETWCQH